VIVTTSYHPSAETTSKAHRLADELGWRFVARGRDSLRKLRESNSTGPLLLVTHAEVQCLPESDGLPIFFHPGMAHVRVQRLVHGESDTLLTATEVGQGDTIIDCTAGLAADSIVLAHAVGDEGRVIAIDSQPVVCAILREGISTYISDVAAINSALRRIEIVCADHLAYLRGLPDNSADIIYFDPMFRHPIDRSDSISPLRAFANPNALSPESLTEALRVARKRIVMKEGRGSGEFARLGFGRIIQTGTKLAYGVIQCDN
jgi:16S rRNA (guanine1516-N2)-methyltransferase